MYGPKRSYDTPGCSTCEAARSSPGAPATPDEDGEHGQRDQRVRSRWGGAAAASGLATGRLGGAGILRARAAAHRAAHGLVALVDAGRPHAVARGIAAGLERAEIGPRAGEAIVDVREHDAAIARGRARA